MPPFGNLFGFRVVVDPALESHQHIDLIQCGQSRPDCPYATDKDFAELEREELPGSPKKMRSGTPESAKPVGGPSKVYVGADGDYA